MPTTIDEDRTIQRLQRLRAGSDPGSATLDRDANELFVRYRGPLRAYCRSYVGDAAKADELANDVLLTAWRRLDAYDFSSTFRGWLFGIARFTCLRAREKRKDLLVEDGVLDVADSAVETWRVASRQERSALLMAVIDGLDEIEQRAIVMRYFEGLSVNRITEELSLEGSGARGLLQSCRRHLASRLRGEMATRHLDTSYWFTTR